MQHGRRRAEEMREATATVEGVAIRSRMAAATADVQAWVAALRAEGVFDAAAPDADWRDLADRIEPGQVPGSESGRVNPCGREAAETQRDPNR